jgi:DNA-binding winged helix-turn-helix (wHTH) protein
MPEMTHRFGDFALDVEARELTYRGDPVEVQPRVFDLLAYLVAHAGRVVPKDELLDRLWPDIHVTEASLQRAVSLARRALSVGGMEGAIRNYVRHGYRFALDAPRLVLLEGVGPPQNASIEHARALAEARSWSEAAAMFSGVARGENLDGGDLDLWAFCLECDRRAPEAAHVLALAVERHLAAGRPTCAARSATMLSKIHLERSAIAVAKAWLDRAESLLPRIESCEARPLVFWMRSRLASFEGRPEEALAIATEAHAAAEACGIESLKALCLAYIGFYNIALGRVEEGAAQQDLAAAIALSGRADAITGALIYCNILWSCRNVADWSRARQWSSGFETWCSASFATSTGTCDLHRAEVTGVQADLAAALHSVGDALAKMAEEEGWALGEGYRVRGDIHAMIGDVAAARADYSEAYALGWDAEPGHAVLLSEAGEVDAALASLDRSLSGTTWFHLQRYLWVAAHKAWIAAKDGRSALAHETISRIEPEIDGAGRGMASLRALVTEARAWLADTSAEDRAQILLLARQLWMASGFEYHEARCRIEAARCLLAVCDPFGAQIELEAATRLAARIGSAKLSAMAASAAAIVPAQAALSSGTPTAAGEAGRTA